MMTVSLGVITGCPQHQPNTTKPSNPTESKGNSEHTANHVGNSFWC